MKHRSIACPECGAPANVIDTVMNTDANEQYRKKICLECGHVFYTLEFTVEMDDDSILENWCAHHRQAKRRQKNKELYGKTKKPKEVKHD